MIYPKYLNAHSTLMYGYLGYFENNLMLYLKPSNYKLIDRAIRYTQFLLNQNHHQNYEYKIIAGRLLQLIPSLKPKQSMVKLTIDAMLRQG